MPFYTATAEDVATSGTINTERTILALTIADSANQGRARLVALTAGFAEDTPADTTWRVAVKRIDDLSAGSAGTSGGALTETAHYSDSPAAKVVATEDYSGGEPSTYGSELWGFDLNSRNSVVMRWAPDEAPVIYRDQVLGILVQPRTGAAKQVSVTATWEEF